MSSKALFLILEAMVMYFLVLGAHSLSRRFGPAYFYALLGGLTAVMSWVTDAGLSVEVAGITFVVGSTVFYTSLLLAVFVIYVFDGPRDARIAISTVLGVSIMMPLIAAALHLQAELLPAVGLIRIPRPSLRINAASAAATFLDLIFLGILWEFLGKPSLKINLWLRTFFSLLGVMWLDVLLFSTGAFAGTPAYLSIMSGTLLSRLVIASFAFPFLSGYLRWQSGREELTIVNRPVLSILTRFNRMERELTEAQREITRRKQVERERDRVIKELAESRQKYKELSERLHQVSMTDELTGVANRRFFNQTLKKEWRRARRGGGSLSLLIMDVDHFKEFNDRYGHLAGDRCLRQIAHLLAEVFQRPGDLFARFGGDEFAAVLPETERGGALKVAENCQQALAGVTFAPEETPDQVTIELSIGVSTAQPAPSTETIDLIHAADQALYQAKEKGRDRVEFTTFQD